MHPATIDPDRLREADADLAAVLAKTPPERHAQVLEVAAAQNPNVAALLGIDPEPAPTPGEFTESETGNARRFVATFGDDFRYAAEARGWFTWTGTRWSPDTKKTALAKTADVAEAIRKEALHLPAQSVEGRAYQERLLKWGNRSLSDNVRNNTLDLAQCEPGMCIEAADFDKDPWLLNCQNGTIDLRTGELRDHRREDLLTHCLPVEFDAKATCPRWEQFLQEIFPDDSELPGYLQRAVGYALSGTLREQCFFVLFGHGANGKSVFLNTLRHVLGALAKHTAITTFSTRQQGQATEDRYQLKGARLVTVSESSRGQHLDESFVKDVTGGEPLRARLLYQNSEEITPRFSLFLATNHRPTITGTDEAIWRRVKLIPFARYFKPSERDAALPETLRSEAPGILAWAVRGCLEWQANGLQEPATVTEASNEYRSDSDTLGEFIDDRCTLCRELSTAAGALYGAYQGWAEAGGYKAMNARNFGLALSERGFAKCKVGGTRMYRGITLSN